MKGLSVCLDVGHTSAAAFIKPYVQRNQPERELEAEAKNAPSDISLNAEYFEVQFT
jgi:hypothetical protein